MSNPTDSTVTVNFLKQGGKVVEGTAIGRQGKTLFLIAYRIQSGSPRERWIKADRVQGTPQWDKRMEKEDAYCSEKRPMSFDADTHAALLALPRWAKRPCPVKGEWYSNCPQCGTWITQESGVHKALVRAD